MIVSIFELRIRRKRRESDGRTHRIVGGNFSDDVVAGGKEGGKVGGMFACRQ